jgi:threonine dehydrogenase-like Zn-dependent dehydrogenase
MQATVLYAHHDIRFEDRDPPKIVEPTDAANVEPGSSVVVVGDGAVGLLGVLSAKQMGAERIIAMDERRRRMDRSDQKQRLARRPRACQGSDES